MDPNDVTLKNLAIFQRYIHTFRPYKLMEDNLPTPNLQVFFFALTAFTTPAPKSWPRSFEAFTKRWSREQVCWTWYLWEWYGMIGEETPLATVDGTEYTESKALFSRYPNIQSPNSSQKLVSCRHRNAKKPWDLLTISGTMFEASGIWGLGTSPTYTGLLLRFQQWMSHFCSAMSLTKWWHPHCGY